MANRKEDYPELRVRCIGQKTINEINNIADHVGVPTNTFMKMKLQEIIKSYPEKMRLPKEQQD